MEPHRSLLEQSLQERITPVLLLLPTPAVEESCRKNDLSFIDILRPFSSVHGIDVPVRTASEQPYRLQEFSIRMFYAADICQTSVESAEECLLKVVNSSSEEALAALDGDPQNLEVIKKVVQSESLSSWFQKYSKAFVQTLAFSDHETFDHPIACIRAVSSRDDNPIHKFVELYDTDPMPTLLRDGVMDANLLKVYVLVHDLQDGPADRANEILSEMRGSFGYNECWLLCINSGSSDSGVGEDFWKSDVLCSAMTKTDDSAPERRRGILLSENDLNEINELLAQVCCKSILPHMEQKIRSLNQQVVATKKGLRNQIKNFWWRKGKDDVLESNNPIMYTAGSIESQIRVLADYSFMLRDYELALSNYRLISSDYKADKAWKHYAGAQEMVGLSLFMLDQSRKEAESSMESAFNTYQKLVPSGQRYATRNALWWAEMHKARGQYKEAASVLFRAGTEEPHLRAGIFLEQAAYCYLRATPSMMRKYGFYLVLAANRYNVCGQKKHALRAYSSVLKIFEGQGWNYINDHVLFHLGRLSAFLGDYLGAVQHFRKLVCCNHQSSLNQAAFLKEFVQAVQNSSFGKDSLLLLDLPAINKESLRVYFEDQRTYASVAASMLPDEAWSPLEAGLIPLAQTNIKTWLDSAVSKNSNVEASDYNESIAGETLVVEVELINPLRVSLSLSSVSLLYRFDKEASDEKEGPPESVSKMEFSDKSDDSTLSVGVVKSNSMTQRSCEWQDPSVTVIEESLILSSEEHHKLQLKVIPHLQGRLHITGVRWTLSGTVRGYQIFASAEEKTESRKGKHDRLHVCPPHKRLKFHVRECMPRMEVSLHGMPESISSGELCRVVLELSNTSNDTIKNLKFCTSQPGVLVMGEIEHLDKEFPNCLEAPFEEKQIMAKEQFNGGSFPETVILESGTTLFWPLWLHGGETGTILVNIVLYYEASNASGRLLYRTVRMTHTLEVLPSVQVSFHISLCLLRFEHYLLRLDISNKHDAESIWLRQVSCVGRRWQIAPLLPPVTNLTESGEGMTESYQEEAAFLSASVTPSQLLPARQSLSLFFQLLDVGAPSSSTEPECISNVRLGPPSNTTPLIDATKGPVSRFHALMRRSKEKEHLSRLSLDPWKVSETTLDLILISEQQDEGATVKPSALRDCQRLATHHICYCSPKQSSPLVWLMEGPASVCHDFAKDSFCTVSFSLTIKNYSCRAASLKISMASSDRMLEANTINSKAGQGNQSGWYDISLEASSESNAQEDGLSTGSQSIILAARPFLWSCLSFIKVDKLGSGETQTYPLHLSVFAPGVYDLSGYHVQWELLPGPVIRKEEKDSVFSETTTTFSSDFVDSEMEQKNAGDSGFFHNRAEERFSGSGYGHPYILTVQDKQQYH